MAPRTNDEGLSHREELFVHAYIANGGNGTDAAIKAGYTESNARARASELLDKPVVRKAIERYRGEIVREFKITARRVLQEMSNVGFSRYHHYVIGEDGHLTLATDAPEGAAAAIKRVKRKVRFIPQGKDEEPIKEVETEFELWSKDMQLRNLGEYLKLFKENRSDGDDTDEDDLTDEQCEELLIGLVKKAAQRAKAKRGAK